ncbi:apolipoprotein C-IV [Corythoichthys intestinalis]|uniref:apolipoprotein C-IV n=1 Tax=Corythoichthys intestinalis TaxID=161448 RepID=UPI0025A68858|nr:apolipoprotein C-IV [Corythoichthys intestinalis]XP_057691261.1 apolipoprotein C-IV [Corythoichthys intestinalis]
MKFFIVALILLIQACGPLWAQTPAPGPPDSPGMLTRLFDKARAAKENVETALDVVIDFAGEYYGEHIQPVVDNYRNWAAGMRTSAREKMHYYLPLFMPNTTDG